MPARLSDPHRLAALERSGLLHRGLDERLERLVSTAASVLSADAAQMNVLDAVRQHHLNRWPPVSDTGSPVADSGCQHVVAAGATVVVPDVVAHPVFCMMPWAGVEWGSYLGTPICYDNEPIGALCVLTHDARQWSRADVMALEAVARLVELALF